MRRHLLLALLVIGGASCKRQKMTSAETVLGRSPVADVEMIDYDYPAGGFTCRTPADWKGKEDEKVGASLTLIGPGTKENPLSARILVTRHPNSFDKHKTAEEYLSSPYFKAEQGGKYETFELNGRKAFRFREQKPFYPLHSRTARYTQSVEHVLIDVPGGYYHLLHSAPAQDAAKTLPVFEALVQSFTPKP